VRHLLQTLFSTSTNLDFFNNWKDLILIAIWKPIKQVFLNFWLWGEKLITSLGGRTIVMLVGALLIAMLSILFTDNWIVSISRHGRSIGNIRNNLIALNQLKENLYKAESAQRGYLITNDEIYIAPFDKVIGDARANIKYIELGLRNSINNDTFSKEQLADIESLSKISSSLEAKVAEMKVSVGLANKGKVKEARQVVNLDVGLKEMQNFIQRTNKLIDNQNNDLVVLIKEREGSILLARLSVLGGALILIILVVLVIKQLLIELVTKNELQQQVLRENEIYESKLQHQTKLLRSLALDYQSDVERERQKLSRELHDELGSIFTAIKMDMAWVLKKLKDIVPEVVDKLKVTNRYIDQGISYQRHIVQELHPAMISTFGFWPALKSLIDDAAERNQWQLSLDIPDQNTKLNETISLVAYRIVQETLNNANKYAKATAISVHMMIDDKFLKLEILDNGVGVNMNALDGNTHGLSGMRHRVMAIGGHFEILSEPGKGVLTRALIPLDVAAL
jgi:signal transduction histidine kinase